MEVALTGRSISARFPSLRPLPTRGLGGLGILIWHLRAAGFCWASSVEEAPDETFAAGPFISPLSTSSSMTESSRLFERSGVSSVSILQRQTPGVVRLPVRASQGVQREGEPLE